MKRRITAMCVCVLLAMGLLAGCSAANEPASTGDSSAVSEQTGTEQTGTDQAAAWDAEKETNKLNYKEIDTQFGELTKDMVPEGFTIGVAGSDATNDYWTDMIEGMEERCAELGIDATITTCVGPTNYDENLANAESLYGIGYDAYIFSPQNDTVLEELTKKIVSEGTPVVNAYACQLSSASVLVGSLDGATAEKAAQLAVDLVGNDAEAAVVMGHVSAKLAQVRTYYFKDYLAANTNINVTEVPASWDPTAAQSMVSDLLATNPDVKFIFSNNDAMALGAYEGLREKGVNDEVYLVGMDGTSSGLSSVAAGEMYGTYYNDPNLIGRLSVDAAVRLALGQELPRIIETDVELVTMENVGDYIE